MISHMWLEPESYKWMTERLVEAAEEQCGGRVVSVLEGGYQLDYLGQAVVHHLAAMAASR